jgi:hypothetical protein
MSTHSASVRSMPRRRTVRWRMHGVARTRMCHAHACVVWRVRGCMCHAHVCVVWRVRGCMCHAHACMVWRVRGCMCHAHACMVWPVRGCGTRTHAWCGAYADVARARMLRVGCCRRPAGRSRRKAVRQLDTCRNRHLSQQTLVAIDTCRKRHLSQQAPRAANACHNRHQAQQTQTPATICTSTRGSPPTPRSGSLGATTYNSQHPSDTNKRNGMRAPARGRHE